MLSFISVFLSRAQRAGFAVPLQILMRLTIEKD
jgi:hypothetical protein